MTKTNLWDRAKEANLQVVNEILPEFDIGFDSKDYELVHCLYSELEFMDSIICQCESFSTFLNEKDDPEDALKMIIGWLKMIVLSADTALLNLFTLSEKIAYNNVDKINYIKQSLKDIKLKTENVMNDCQKYLGQETIRILTSFFAEIQSVNYLEQCRDINVL